jgi:hypothetical protein
MCRATVDGLKRLVRPEDVAAMRGLTIAQVLPVSDAARAARKAKEAEAVEGNPAADAVAVATESEEKGE